jgi:hypothetical protein
MKTTTNDLVQEIIEAYRAASKTEDAYLWIHTSGDAILWQNAEVAENDNGARAIGRWQLTDEDDDASEFAEATNALIEAGVPFDLA